MFRPLHGNPLDGAAGIQLLQRGRRGRLRSCLDEGVDIGEVRVR